MTTYPAKYSGFNEIAFNTGAALDDGTPIGDGHPALKDASCGRRYPTRSTPRRWSTGCSAATAARQQRHPAALRDAALRPGRRRPTRSTSEKAKTLLDEAGYTEGAGRHPHDAGRRPEAVVPAVRPAATRRPASRRCSSWPGWLEDIGIEVKAEDRVRGRPDRDHRRGQLRHVRVGLGGRARPELPAVDVHLRQPLRTRTAAASTPTCPTRSTATRSTTRSTPSRPSRSTRTSARRPSRQMQKMLYDDAPYIVTFYYDNLQAYRSDRFTELPAAAGSRTGRCCSSTAPTATRASGR